MAKKETPFETLVKAPWWVGTIVLVLGNFFIRTVIPAFFAGGKSQGPLGPALHGAFSQAMPIVATLFSLVVIAAMVFSFIREKFMQLGTGGKFVLPYKSREILFTPAELNFLDALENVLKDDYKVYGKVRLADIIEPRNNLESGAYKSSFNRICSKHVDFVICNARTCAIETVIELDDRSHDRKDRQERDDFLEKALAAANVLIARFPVKRAYSLKDLQERLGDFVVSTAAPVWAKSGQSVTPSSPPAGVEAVVDASVCKVCGSEMKMREKKSGADLGKKFMVCTKFPECRNVEPCLETGWF